MPSRESASTQETLREIFQLSKSYALQETVDPLKGLGKFVAFGVGAAVLGGVGLILMLLGVLRLLQTETGDTFVGDRSWVPYLITLVIAGVAIGIAVLSIAQKKKAAL